MKLKEKDALLVTGPAHYEKALVDSVLKGNKYKLNNGMTIDNNLNIISIVTSKFKVELFDEDKYNYLLSMERIPRILGKINNEGLGKLPNESVVKLYNKLRKMEEKYL